MADNHILEISLCGERAHMAARAVSQLLLSMGASVTLNETGDVSADTAAYGYEVPLNGVTAKVNIAR